MKNLLTLLVSLFSFSLMAASADYQCSAGQYRVALTLTQDRSTHIELRDDYGFLYQAYAGTVEKSGTLTKFTFYPAYEGSAQLVVRTEDAINFPSKLLAKLTGSARGFILRETLNCYRD